MFNALPDRGYFISIGGEHKMFTLRQGNAVGEEWHIQNLSHTWEAAEAKAFEVTGLHLDAPETQLDPLKAHETIDTAVIRFGKHKNRFITDVAETDLRYLIWLTESMIEAKETDPNYKVDRTIKLISELPEVIEAIAEKNRKWEERQAKWKAEAESLKKSSVHMGTIGERIEFTGTITFTKSFENAYGIGYMSKVITDNGCEVMYWNLFGVDAKDLGFEFHKLDGEKGDRITFFAAVKDHSEYEGVKQTVVKRATRAKLLCPGEDTTTYLKNYPCWYKKDLELPQLSESIQQFVADQDSIMDGDDY